MTSSAAAELLRGYAPAGASLDGCLQLALAATVHDEERRARVERAALVLNLSSKEDVV